MWSRIWVSFDLVSKVASLESLSTYMGAEPKRSHRRGDRWIGAKLWKETLWSIESGAKPTDTLNVHLSKLRRTLDRLKVDLSAAKRIRANAGIAVQAVLSDLTGVLSLTATDIAYLNHNKIALHVHVYKSSGKGNGHPL